MQKSVKEEMLNTIRLGNFSVKDIIEFRINKNDYLVNNNGIIWEDENEFEHLGNMYDVIRSKDSCGIKVLYCLKDNAEELIVKNFNDEINSLARGDLSKPGIKTSLLNIITQALIKNSFQFNSGYKQQTIVTCFAFRILLTDRDIPSPPPRFC